MGLSNNRPVTGRRGSSGSGVSSIAALAAAVLLVACGCVAVSAVSHGARDALGTTIPAPITPPTGDAIQAAMDADTQLIEQLSAHEEAVAARAQAERNADADADSDDADADDEADDEAEADDESSYVQTEAITAASSLPGGAGVAPDSMLQVAAQAEAAAAASHRPRGIGYIALPRKDGTVTRVDLARKAFRERIRRRLKGGGMMRRYAPELFGQDIYGADDNDNVKLGSRETIFNAMNGPFAPLDKPHQRREAIQPEAIKRAMYLDALAHKRKDKAAGIRHSEYYLKNDPSRGAFQYVPKNHRNPYGFGRVFAKARRDQALMIGPFDNDRFRHGGGHPDLAFSKGAQKNSRLPLPSNPRLPFAEADALIQGLRPSKLQAFPEFKPPPKIPKFAAPPPEDKTDAPTNGDTPEF